MENSTGGDVRIVSRRLVRPEPASSPGRPPEVIHLTPWDLTLITVDHIQKGILLPKPRTTGGAALADELASSLALALGRFYPLAGRLAASEITGGDNESAESGPRLAISLRCTGEGAELVHAVAPGVTVSDIVTPLYTPPVVSSFFPLNGLLNVEAVVGSLPVLAAQLTELADGVFVAVSLNHGVADGTTFWHLFNAWSEINRCRRRGSEGEGDGFELSTLPPVMDRWFVDACPVPIPLPFSKPEDLVRRPEYTPVQECFLHFSAESVKKLKAKANAEMAAGTEPPAAAGATLSSLQSLLGHLWRALCRARCLAADQETTYVLAIGLRGRVRCIPQEYVGNAVVLHAAASTAAEVLGEGGGGLGRAAWLLNRAVASLDEAKLRRDLAAWARSPSTLYVTPRRNPARAITGSSPRFDVYGNDFGWGRPVAVRSGAGNKVDGKVTVYEGREGGGSMALEVCLSPEALARLVADEEFMEAVTVSAGVA
ncbi:hypothetical protein BS78_07G012300 [Paspalum vaginatum]|nr:hypothetical protein BS78_07G012300 [Paspalum vaginatum]